MLHIWGKIIGVNLNRKLDEKKIPWILIVVARIKKGSKEPTLFVTS